MRWRIGALGDIASIATKAVQPSATPTELFEHYSIPAFDEGMTPEVVPG
jgi:type I restriction enzyme, S subunit